MNYLHGGEGIRNLRFPGIVSKFQYCVPEQKSLPFLLYDRNKTEMEVQIGKIWGENNKFFILLLQKISSLNVFSNERKFLVCKAQPL